MHYAYIESKPDPIENGLLFFALSREHRFTIVD